MAPAATQHDHCELREPPLLNKMIIRRRPEAAILIFPTGCELFNKQCCPKNHSVGQLNVGMGLICQISSAYSRTVRSLENLPAAAVLLRHMRPNASLS